MSNAKQTEPGGTAVKALAAAAASGAATYAVRKALATRNGHDDENAEQEGDEVRATESEADDSDYPEDEDEWEGSAEEEDEEAEDEEEEPTGDDDEDDVPEGSADEDDDSEESNGADRSSEKGSLRQLVDPSRLGSLSHLLVPVAGEAADSAGRYVAEHTSDAVQEQVVNRFIEAFEKAS